MKRILIITACIAAFCPFASAGSPWSLSGGLDLGSSYYFAGQTSGGVTLHPELCLDYAFSESFSLSVGVSADTDFGLSTVLPLTVNQDPYSMGTVYLGASFGQFEAYLSDEIYGNPALRASHYVTAELDWILSEDRPLALSWYSLLSGDDFSTVLSASYGFSAGECFTFSPKVEFIPWTSGYCDETEGAHLCFAGLDAVCELPAGESLCVPVELLAGWNPALGVPVVCLKAGVAF